MKEHDGAKRRDWLYLGMCAVLVGYSVWVLSSLVDSDGPSVELKWVYRVARICQGVARTFGKWGMEAERVYLELAERERMI